MIRRVVRKLGTVMLAAGLCIAMSCPTAFAATKVHNVELKNSARYIQPEEWNNEEIKLYQFDSEDEFETYQLTGGMHLYNKKYSVKDHWVKLKAVDSGALYIESNSTTKDKIPLYDASKKKILKKDLDDSYMVPIKAGEELYAKLPSKIDKIILTAGIFKSEFGSFKKTDDTYYEIGKATTTEHPFSITKRSVLYFDITVEGKKIGNVIVNLEQYKNGKWEKVGYTGTVKPSEDKTITYGLQPGKYRLKLKNPKDQLISIEYMKYTENKDVSYKRSKAFTIRSDTGIENIYTEGEQAARWYKASVKTVKQKRNLLLAASCVGGGFKFEIYKNGQKKPMKTVSVKNYGEPKGITLPKEKATYYIKVSKLTKKTNGKYVIEEYED